MLSLLRGLRPFLKTSPVVLRNERSPGNLRHLSARYSSDGDLVIEGQDLGDAVRTAFGYQEYEWVWTIARTELPKLAEALGSGSNPLSALGRRFSGPAAAGLGEFLDDQRIVCTKWSRVGD